MKVAYSHLINFIPSRPTIDEISQKFFQLGHEHEIEDNIFNMELTPNRGDCLSINGLLRDLAVFYDVNISKEVFKKNLDKLKIDFTNNAREACPHISFLKIDIETEIMPYHGELKDYFHDLDVNKNNFFTDISNYISYETGQPTHCYDAQKINNSFSLVQNNNEHVFETVIDKKINLKGKNLVFVHNDSTVINLAGVMGGANTACTKDTRSVIIECATFNPEYLIGQSIKYDIKSDAAHKYERGVDPLCHENVLRRFLKIVDNHTNIKNAEFFIKNYKEHAPVQIPFSKDRLNNILGISLNQNDYNNYLSKLGFNIEDNIITVPSYRNDVTSENDIAEEIARVIGYNNITPQQFKISDQVVVDGEDELLELNIKNILISNGFFEVINNPFIGSKTHNSIKVDNPLDSNREYMRTSLKESLINNLLYNERRQKDSIKLFEISDIYVSEEEITSKKMLGIICSGRVARNYLDFSKKIDKYYLLNVLKKLSTNINFSPQNIERNNLESKSNNQIVYIEIELDVFKNGDLNSIKATQKINNYNFVKYKPISEYPYSVRDLSFSIIDFQKYYDLQEFLLNYKNDLIKEIFIFDFFENKKNNEIKIGFRFIFQSKTATITESQVNHEMEIIIESALSIDSVSIPGLKK
jgi:phenylalanyl-tRNA synthetase beta chain